jgi:hypothetical protein
MPKTIKKTSPQAIESALANLPGSTQRAGMPARDSIIGVTEPAKGAAKKGFSIIHTNEIDEYEKGAASPAAFAAAKAALPTGDNYAGTDRKAAKLSISSAKPEKFNDLKDLVKSLTAEDKMKNHKPKIGTDAKSDRVKEEQRNVSVKAFLYAASREADNDFHLIIGRDPKASPELYMTMELSGLPTSGPALAPLKAARSAFKKFFKDNGGQPPGLSYDFYDPPIQLNIDGSLFFDMTHASGSRPGPKSLKSRMPVIWEVHPITSIVLKKP